MEYVPRINIKDYDFIKTIGSGNFGTVSLVRNIKDNLEYAAKEECNSEFDNEVEIDDNIERSSRRNTIMKELKTYTKIKNAAILNCIGYSPYNLSNLPNYTLIMEYMPNKSLDKLLQDAYNSCAPITYTNTAKYIILIGTALGMKYIHNKGIIHRDLKPGNILLDEHLYPKICDFGCSKVSDKELTHIMMKTEIGTPMYMAPEIYTNDSYYNYKVDVYAFSYVAYEIITGEKPFKDITSVFQFMGRIIEGERPDTTKIGDAEICKFLEKCWSPDQSKRPSFLQIVEELMQERFRNYFNVVEDDDDVNEYLDMFDDELKSPLSKDALNVKKDADNGNVESMFLYGMMLCKGIGAPINKKEGIKYYKMAIEKGHQGAMLNYAIMLHDGDGIPVDKKESAKILRMATDIPQAVYNLSYQLINGDGIPADKKEGIRLCEKAAEMGDVLAMKYLSKIYSRGVNVPVNLETSAHYCKMAAENGDVDSMFIYGEMLSENIVPSSSKIEGVLYLRLAADMGSVNAMTNYGIMLIDGEGIPVNINEGMKYLKMASEKNFPNAFFAMFIAIFKFNGYPLDNETFVDSVNKYLEDPKELNNDMKNAIAYLKKAADLDYLEAIYYYGFMRYIGFAMECNKEEGIEYIIKSYEKGKKEAFQMVVAFLLHQNGDENGEEVLLFLKMSVDRGDVHAMLYCSYLLLQEDILGTNNLKEIKKFSSFNIENLSFGKKIKKNEEEGLKYLKMAADHGDIFAMRQYSTIMIDKKNQIEGLKYLKMAADQGDIESMKVYGGMLIDDDSVEKNEVEGAKYIKKAADRGDYTAIGKYGELLYHGKGVTANKKGASKLYKIAADGGIDFCMYSYARMLRHGDGIPQNIKESIKYYKMAIDKGHSISMINYAHMLFNGEGIPVDRVEAAKYYKMSADHGYTNAMINLGRMMFYGEGIPKNKKEGLRYFKMGADLGNQQSMFLYGKILYEGHEIQGNVKEGYEYIKKAADNGYPIAILYLSRLNSKRSDEEENNNNNKNTYDNFFDCNFNTQDEPTTKSIYDISIYTYPTQTLKDNLFLYISEFSFSGKDFELIDRRLQSLSSYKSKHGHMIHAEDPNKLYTFYFFLNNDSSIIKPTIDNAVRSLGVKVPPLIYNINLYFEENTLQPNVLKIILKKLKKIPQIKSIQRNIFDGRQIATYINADYLDQAQIIQSLKRYLLKKNLAIDTEKYPLLRNIIINEKMMLGYSNAFDIIVDEIKSYGIIPIDILRNTIYIYNENHLKKLFQVFSFICFKDENEKMLALNHINSILFRDKPNVLKYKMNLHYATLNVCPLGKPLRKSIVKIFQSFDGVEDIQHNVYSIESPCLRTYIGFDTMPNLKKACEKYFYYKSLAKKFAQDDFEFFAPRKNLFYLKIKTNHNDLKISEILYAISRNASDFQENCFEYSNSFDRSFASYMGFNTMQKYKKIYKYLSLHPEISNADISEYIPKQNIETPVLHFDEETYIYYESF